MRNPILKDNYYHLYLRGVDKRDIFLDENDYKRFLKLLNYCNIKNNPPFSTLLRKSKKKIYESLKETKEEFSEIIISTLMPNHFHILVKCLFDKSVSKHMQKVLGSYAMYFNKKYKKKGYKFENKFQYRLIENDPDLQNTIDYIYHNPAKLLDNNYKHLDFLNGFYRLSRDQMDYVKSYKYTYKGPTFVEFKERFNLYFL